MSPEQVRGENIDARSNIYSLGALFYEMVTDHKAFDSEDSESLRQSILDSAPVPPSQLNPKLHPVLSALIMKALAKDPGERYQGGRELLDDLEKCKESKPQAAKAPAAAPRPSGCSSRESRGSNKICVGVGAGGKNPRCPQPPVASRPSAQPAVAKAEPARKAAAGAAGYAGAPFHSVNTLTSKPSINPRYRAPKRPIRLHRPHRTCQRPPLMILQSKLPRHPELPSIP